MPKQPSRGSIPASVLCVAALLLLGARGVRHRNGAEGRTTARTHVVTVNADGSFSPEFLYVADGDTVEWRLHERTDSIVPAQSSEPFPAICSGQKAYDADNPNEFTGPMPRWPSGIFTLGPDDRGLVITSSAASCPGGMAVAVAAGQFLCRGGPQAATMDWTWQNPNLTGVFVRIQWKDVHKGSDNFDWSILDRELDKAVQNGKLYSLAFKAGSNGTPDWIFADAAAPVTRLTFQDVGDEADCDAPPCCGVRMDLGSPADPNYRKHYFDLLAAVAEHVKSRNDWYRALAYFKPSGLNLFTHENRLPNNCQCGCEICNTEVWATQGDYTPAALYDFYRQQTDLLTALFPEKSMSYALIQAGFPLVNSASEYETCEDGKPASPMGTEQTEEILRGGRVLHGLDFVVQHNGLGVRPQDRTVPLAACPDEGVHPKTGPFSNSPGCPNRWVLREGAAGQITAFQTNNASGVANPVDVESSLRNALDNSDAVFVEIYEERFWESEVAGPILDPNASGRTSGQWADAFHAQRRNLWPNLPDPFPLVHRHTFTRTAGPGTSPELFQYIHGAKCGKGGSASFGVIAVLPQGAPTPANTPSPAATNTSTRSHTPTPTPSPSTTNTRTPTVSATAARTAPPSATPTSPRSPSASPTPSRTPCPGDCNADGSVTVDELVRGVNMALGTLPVSECQGMDVNRDGHLTVDELVAAVNAALRGCMAADRQSV